jgi:hypothetical protein
MATGMFHRQRNRMGNQTLRICLPLQGLAVHHRTTAEKVV